MNNAVKLYTHTHTHTHTYARTRGGRDSLVGIATCYGLDGPRIESQREAHPAPCTMATGSFPGMKRSGSWQLRPTLTNAEFRMVWSYTVTYPLPAWVTLKYLLTDTQYKETFPPPPMHRQPLWARDS